ncbi:MAG TPA: hypothetical protein PLW65_22840, partial [Pseudomonadota bacterium]|nr:hypothetical protein [Pseudomonadota bacterium]
MDYRTFEQRLLDTIFTTDVQLNPATIAFLYKLSVQEASDLLQQAAVAGLLNIESDDEGNILYTYPNRVRLGSAKDKAAATETALARTRQGPMPPGEAGVSLVRSDALAAQLQVPETVPSVIDMTEVAGGGPGREAPAGTGFGTA